jgi:hypothetical protein
MGDISVNGAQVQMIYPDRAEAYDQIAAETLTGGAACYLTSAGKQGLADANASGKEQCTGVMIPNVASGVGAGQGFTLLRRGHVAGFDLSGLAYGALVYLSDTPGKLADAASATKTVRVGRVVALPDSSLTKALYIDADWSQNF